MHINWKLEQNKDIHITWAQEHVEEKMTILLLLRKGKYLVSLALLLAL
ncbi:hypothetical protein [Peribacillus sp. SCS-155]